MLLLSCGRALGSSDTWKGRKGPDPANWQCSFHLNAPTSASLAILLPFLMMSSGYRENMCTAFFWDNFWPFGLILIYIIALSLCILPRVSVGFNISSYLFPNNTQLQHIEKACWYFLKKGLAIIWIIGVTVISPGHKSIHILQDINHALNGWDLKEKLPSWTCCFIIAYYGSFTSFSEASGTGTISLVWNDNSCVPLWSIPMTL